MATFAQLMTEEQVAEKLQITPTTLRRWRWDGRGPSFIRMGRQVRYDADELQRYIEENTFVSAKAAAAALSRDR